MRQEDKNFIYSITEGNKTFPCPFVGRFDERDEQNI
jgi:hypothetical protein